MASVCTTPRSKATIAAGHPLRIPIRFDPEFQAPAPLCFRRAQTGLEVSPGEWKSADPKAAPLFAAASLRPLPRPITPQRKGGSIASWALRAVPITGTGPRLFLRCVIFATAACCTIPWIRGRPWRNAIWPHAKIVSSAFVWRPRRSSSFSFSSCRPEGFPGAIGTDHAWWPLGRSRQDRPTGSVASFELVLRWWSAVSGWSRGRLKTGSS